jgi:hypothetical protein
MSEFNAVDLLFVGILFKLIVSDKFEESRES